MADLVSSISGVVAMAVAGRTAAALLVFATVAMATWAAGATVARRRSGMIRLLGDYTDTDTAGVGTRPDQLAGSSSRLVRGAAVLTARMATRARMSARLDAKLEEADVPLRSSAVVLLTLLGATLVSLVSLVATGSVVSIVFVLAIAGCAPFVWLQTLIRRRRRAFESQLPEVLRMLSGALRSGYSLSQGMQSVAGEIAEPISSELRRALAQARLGESIDEALAEAGRRMHNRDWEVAVCAIRIQREVGGNLAELLNGVADTMVSRERLRRDVRTLTAEGRLSALVLGALPPAIGLMMFLRNPEYISVLFTEPLGRVLLGGSSLLVATGFVWIRRTVRIEL